VVIVDPSFPNEKPALAAIYAPGNHSHFLRAGFKLGPAQAMKFIESLKLKFRAPKLTRTRIILALAAALLADSLQLLLGPAGWAFVDQAIDVAAMLLTAWAIGFHLLLLPTFLAEFVPGVDLLPTWTACVLAVIALRKRDQNAAQTRLKAGRE
jgi:hypothetical protein